MKFSPEFIEKAKRAQETGFNIYALSNRFYKTSKLTEKLPEEVLDKVLDRYLMGGDIKDKWPYFIGMLKKCSSEYFANKSQKYDRSVNVQLLKEIMGNV